MSDAERQESALLEGSDAEKEKLSWWGVALGDEDYVVKALSDDEATTKVQTQVQVLKGDATPITSIVQLYDQESQELIDDLYGNRDVVRVIRFSFIEYPTNFVQITEEQQQAFDRLNRDHTRE